MPEQTHQTYRDGVLVSTVTVNVPQTDVNREVLRDRLRAEIAENATYVAITTPTAAQTAAHVKRLSRQNTAIIRMLVGVLDSTD